MDIRQLLNNLDRVALSEAISLKDVETAVAGIKDEQERAAKLNDLAWSNKLPGLYDPVSGYFVGKQSQPNSSMGGRYNIAASGSERSDRALADMGLIPDNAKTSTALGRMFRGDDKDQYSQDIKGRSSKVVTGQNISKFKTDTLPKLKDLVTQLNAAVTAVKGSSGSGSFGGIKIPGVKETSIFESLLNEFQDVIIDQDIDEADPVNPAVAQMASGQGSQDKVKLAPEVQKIYDELKTLLTTAEKSDVVSDPEIAKEIQTARDAIATAERDGTEKPAAAPATADGDKKSSPFDLVPKKDDPKLPVDSGQSKEQRLARVKELLAKAKAPSNTSSNTAPKNESMSELIARIQRIAEGTNELQEALTAAEYKELQTYAAGLKTDFPDDPEIQTLTKQALDLPAQFSSDEKPTTTTDPNKPTDPTKKPGVSDPRVQKVQEQLKALGVDPGPIDGRMGPKTEGGIKAFEKLAGLPETGKITPELEKLLADGKNVIARSKLTQSLVAIETLMTKYKISESITLEDLEIMTESELRSFVMANIKVFSEAEQMSILKQYITESDLVEAEFKAGGDAWKVLSKNPTTGEIILKSISTGKEQSSTNLMKLFPGEMARIQGLEKSVAKSTRIPTTGAAPTPQGTGSVKNLGATEKDLQNIRNRNAGTPGAPGAPAAPAAPGKANWLDKAKGVYNKISGAAARNPKTAKVMGVLTLAAAGFGIGGFMDWIKGGNLEMDPADLAELQKHLKVLEEFGKNPEVVKGLPVDVQKRLEVVLGKLNKLQQAKSKAPAATPPAA